MLCAPSKTHVKCLFLSLQNEKWKNIQVGDVIKLENNQSVAVSNRICLHTERFQRCPDGVPCGSPRRRTSSFSAAANPVDSVTSRPQSLMGKCICFRAYLEQTSKSLETRLQNVRREGNSSKMILETEFLIFASAPNRETNLKVRHALNVTSDMGDVADLMAFDGTGCSHLHMPFKYSLLMFHWLLFLLQEKSFVKLQTTG